jgi:hypothetical protein
MDQDPAQKKRIMDQDTISTKQYTLVVLGVQCPQTERFGASVIPIYRFPKNVDPSTSAISLNQEIGARSFGSVISLDRSDRSTWGWLAGYLACYCYLGLWGGLTVCDSCALARLGRELSRLANTSDRQLPLKKKLREAAANNTTVYMLQH